MPSDDFAVKLLKKYGWSEGTGLGKHRTGITSAIQPGRKGRHANGVGFGADQFDPWWDRVYNTAAMNIRIEEVAARTNLC